MGFGDFDQFLRDPGVVCGFQRKVGQRVIAMPIEAGRNQEELRVKCGQGWPRSPGDRRNGKQRYRFPRATAH